ncbi:nucleoside/nucleotide kinase family protein [Agromyces cerinus]|uniref:Uridine kinase n=1 Tax=Agromyces cerinus subsp. cerinus TaxID=232089 RepID=A0A1N6EPB9_9MICO|nr:hypothetical protein [Agromyces cerinus]SIN84791.1 hypothetical protein SAMN05443544_1333 [Agromyces cerinus subsp. cerinus]
MTRTAYEAQPREELLEGIAEEFLHHASHGRRLIAVDGGGAGVATRFADDLAGVLAEHGQPTLRVSVGDVGAGAGEAVLRADTVDPFRAGTLPGASDDTVLVVDGRGLLDGGARGIWHFSLWLLAGDELPHSGAAVIVDVTDPDAPKRFYYDYCALPPSVNRAGLG